MSGVFHGWDEADIPGYCINCGTPWVQDDIGYFPDCACHHPQHPEVVPKPVPRLDMVQPTSFVAREFDQETEPAT